MKNLLKITILSLAFVSCKDDEGSQAALVDAVLDIKVSSADGRDLLHPETGSINFNEIELDHFINGELIPSRRDRNNPSYADGGDAYLLGVGPLTSEQSGLQTMYLTWPDSDIDTIRADYEKGSNYALVNKFWYNGELVYDRQIIDSKPLHTVIK